MMGHKTSQGLFVPLRGSHKTIHWAANEAGQASRQPPGGWERGRWGGRRIGCLGSIGL